MSALLLTDAPHWFALLCIALGIGAYVLVGLVQLAARLGRRGFFGPGTTRQLPPQLAATVDRASHREEVAS